MRAILLTMLITSIMYAEKYKLEINPSVELATVLGNFSFIYGYVNNYTFHSRIDIDFFHQNQLALTGLRGLKKNERIFVYTFLIKQCNVDITKKNRIWEIVEKNDDFLSLHNKLKEQRFNRSNTTMAVINHLDSNYIKNDTP